MQRYWRLKYPGQKDKEITDRVMFRRGISSEKFLSREEHDPARLSPPQVYSDMEDAVRKILKARDRGQSVLIYGDYDVDGITSTALMWEYLCQRLDMDVTYYLPDRFRDGYGLNREVLHRLRPGDFGLVITVDCGITAVEEIESLQEHETEVIVTDHHRAGDCYPRAGAILNPSCSDKIDRADINPAGVGVVFKLCQALEKKVHGLHMSEFLVTRLDLVALGTVADVIPLRGDNRIFVSRGLEEIKAGNRPGLKMLMKKVGLDGCENLTAGQIGYILAPPFNAAGRLESPDLALQLLLAEDVKRAEMLADRLHGLNRDRQKLEEKIFQDALRILEENEGRHEKAIVLAQEDWHQGVIGIVASRLVERFHRPAVMIALEGDEGKGSARSITGFDLYSALESCSDYLLDYGGHRQAAGLTIKADEISSFTSSFCERADRMLSAEDYLPHYRIDAIVDDVELTRELYDDIQRLRPFGVGNPEPVFMTGDISLKSARRVGSDKKHLKIETESGLEGIGFDLGDVMDDLPAGSAGKRVKLLYKLSLNSWQGRERLQFKFKDIITSEASHQVPVLYEDNLLKLYDVRDGDKREYLKRLERADDRFCLYLNRKNSAEELRGEYAGIDPVTSLQDLRKEHTGIVFFEPPFSHAEIVRGIGNLSAESEKAELHLLFSREELAINKRILDKRLPDRETIETIWEKILQAEEDRITPDLSCCDERSARFWQIALEIFCECSVIKKEDEFFEILQRVDKPELTLSAKFNEIRGVRGEFFNLKNRLEKWDLTSFFNKIKQQIKAEEENQ